MPDYNELELQEMEEALAHQEYCETVELQERALWELKSALQNAMNVCGSTAVNAVIQDLK